MTFCLNKMRQNTSLMNVVQLYNYDKEDKGLRKGQK